MVRFCSIYLFAFPGWSSFCSERRRAAHDWTMTLRTALDWVESGASIWSDLAWNKNKFVARKSTKLHDKVSDLRPAISHSSSPIVQCVSSKRLCLFLVSRIFLLILRPWARRLGSFIQKLQLTTENFYLKSNSKARIASPWNLTRFRQSSDTPRSG